MKRICGLFIIILSMLLLISCGELFRPKQILFSLDNGETWEKSNDILPEFDIWDAKYNDEVPWMVFFYATSYEQFLEEIENNQAPLFIDKRYPDEDGWNKLKEIYNIEYFENYNLLFYYKFEPNISDNYVYNVTVEDNSLTLNINRINGDLTAVTDWLYIVTINKSDVENVTEYNVSVRTITKPKSTVVLSVKEEYIRDIYMNGLSKEDFKGLDNLKDVHFRTLGLKIGIIFNRTVTDEELNEIIDVLEKSENIISIDYVTNTMVNATLNNKLYDKFMDKDLTIIDEFINSNIKDADKFKIEYRDFTKILFVTLEMEKHGKEYYEAMLKQLQELNLPYFNSDVIDKYK